MSMSDWSSDVCSSDLRIALATAVAAFTLDEDMDPLLAACAQAGVTAQRVAWDDPTVSWQRFDAVLLRSTWDYTDRLEEFLAWCERVSTQTQLINPLDVVRWNRSEERSVGNESVSTCRSRWAQDQ